MNTKEKLISKISTIDNEFILEELMEMVDIELALTGDKIQLTNEQKSFIDQGLTDIASGNIISDKEAKNMTKEWLNKR